MDPRTQATFIPKKSVTGDGTTHSGLGFFSLISLIIFLGMVAVAGGVFAYEKILVKAVASEKASLAAEEKKFDPEFISFIVELNNRIDAAKNLLNKHVAVSSVFETLQSTTLRSVQFQSFSFSSTPVAGQPMIAVALKGIARDYAALAGQSQAIGKNKYIKDPLFSNFNLNDQGSVNFTLDALIDPALLDYRRRVEASIPRETEVAPVVTASSTNTIPR